MADSIIAPVFGLIGVVVGSLATIASQWLLHFLQEKAAVKRDLPRKILLLKMLESKKYKWRRFSTLQHVIGADEETTKRLLLEVGARASEDGAPIWGLLERNPLPDD